MGTLMQDLRYTRRMLRKIPRLHRRGHPHAGDGHRREHGDFQSD